MYDFYRKKLMKNHFVEHFYIKMHNLINYPQFS